MRPDEAVVDRGGEDSDDLRVPHLMALLHDLVRGHGRLEAARRLELDPRTVGKWMDGGRMSWRVREALERAHRDGLFLSHHRVPTTAATAPLRIPLKFCQSGLTGFALPVPKPLTPVWTGAINELCFWLFPAFPA